MATKEKLKTQANTPRQDLLIELMVENYGKKGGRRPLASILLEAGYSPETAKNPKKILSAPAVQEALSDVITVMEQKRDLAFKHITEKKLKGAGAYNLALIGDVLTKNIQLLRGRATGHLAVQVGLDEESKQKLLSLMGKN